MNVMTTAGSANDASTTSKRSAAAESVKSYVKREEPATLAKMAAAAIAPQVIALGTKMAWRFALRNPVMTIAGLAVLAYSWTGSPAKDKKAAPPDTASTPQPEASLPA